VTWTPVSYQADLGHYQVSYSNTSGAPYPDTVNTIDKSASSITLSGLTQGANYYFIVKTTTLAHANNQNDVTSVASDEVLVVP
ncbi:MAG: fibronectin type III domain-containing protein, partial [Chloroflexi bacterium]|nr:fibronectin type III domain-containing protein [Chloroflexota bacterium]